MWGSLVCRPSALAALSLSLPLVYVFNSIIVSLILFLSREPQQVPWGTRRAVVTATVPILVS